PHEPVPHLQPRGPWTPERGIVGDEEPARDEPRADADLAVDEERSKRPQRPERESSHRTERVAGSPSAAEQDDERQRDRRGDDRPGLVARENRCDARPAGAVSASSRSGIGRWELGVAWELGVGWELRVGWELGVGS